MKRIFTFLMFLLVSSGIGFSANRNVQADLMYSVFYAPDFGTYLETYLLVRGNSLKFVKNENGQFTAGVEVSMIFSQNEKVIDFEKYEINSHEISDTATIGFNLIDQQRFNLPNGIYTFQISIADKNKDIPPFKSEQTIEISIPTNQVVMSGIELIESYKKSETSSILTKSGLDLIPYISSYYPETVSHLKFYAEVYNSAIYLGENEKFLLSYYLETYETNQKLNDYFRFTRESTKTVNVLLGSFDITKLPSGNYNLVVEARDKNNNQLFINKLFIQRNNPSVAFDYTDFAAVQSDIQWTKFITDRDTLVDYLRSLIPVASESERSYIQSNIKITDFESLKMFFANFWMTRNSTDPLGEWLRYNEQVQIVNQMFGSPAKRGKKGYETDRGIVYLKYGPPNTMSDRPFESSTSGMSMNDGLQSAPDRGSVPYQIWHYYSIRNQRDKKFVFANRELSTNDYELIHSNMPGEISNANWQDELIRVKEGQSLPDRDKYKGKSGELYNLPK